MGTDADHHRIILKENQNGKNQTPQARRESHQEQGGRSASRDGEDGTGKAAGQDQAQVTGQDAARPCQGSPDAWDGHHRRAGTWPGTCLP